MYRSPFGPRARLVGRLNGPAARGMLIESLPSYPVSDGVFMVPRVIRSLPFGVNLRTVWLPSSVQYTLLSGPTVMPWVRYVNSPSPHEPRNLPFGSYMMIG